MGIQIPEELNGAGLSLISSCLVIEELAKVDPAVSVVVDVQNTLVINAIQQFGSPEQHKEWLPRLATESLSSFCLSEAGSGSDAFALKASAVESCPSPISRKFVLY